jgi:hypothetical protein
VGGVSRGSEAKRNDLGERNPGAAKGGGAYTGLLDAVGRVFMPFFIPVKIFYFLYPFLSFFLFIYSFLQNIFNKNMQAARRKLPDKVYSKEFTSFMPETPLKVKNFLKPQF